MCLGTKESFRARFPLSNFNVIPQKTDMTQYSSFRVSDFHLHKTAFLLAECKCLKCPMFKKFIHTCYTSVLVLLHYIIFITHSTQYKVYGLFQILFQIVRCENHTEYKVIIIPQIRSQADLDGWSGWSFLTPLRWRTPLLHWGNVSNFHLKFTRHIYKNE